jgi:hypothetical protein
MIKFFKKLRLRTKIILIITTLVVGAAGGFGAYILTEANKAPAEIEESDAKFQTTLKEAPTDGSLPTEHSPEDVIAYALWSVANSSQFEVITTGVANASIATQQIANARVVKDGRAMISTVSSGMVSVAKQRFFHDNTVLLRDADKIDGVNVVWKNQIPECISYKGNIKRYGWLPFQANGYIICADTYLDRNNIILTDNGDGTYKIVFDLDPAEDKAPFYYRREILTNSSSTIVPVFQKIHFEFTINAKYQLLAQDIQEEYKVKSMGIEALTVTNCHDVFSYENVEFDKDYLDYFESYKDLVAPADDDDSDDGINVNAEDDVMTMIVSSLQKGNNDVNLKVNVNINDNTNLDILAALNISDLNNVKVKAKIDDLFIEYNNDIYVKLGDLKLKGSIDDITNLISGLSLSSDSASSLDVNQILADLNGSEVIKDDNNITINTKLNLLGIELPITFNLIKTDDSYDIKSISANVNLLNNNIKLNVSKEDNISFENYNYAEFDNISNLKFVVDNIFDIVDKKILSLNGDVTYKDLNVKLDGDLSFNDGIYANVNTTVKYKDLELPINLVFKDNTIYFKYNNLKLKITVEELKELISKFTDKTLDNIDIASIIDTVLSIDYDKLLNHVVIDEDLIDINLDLSDFIDKLNQIKISIKNENGLTLNVNASDVLVNLNVKANDNITIVNLDGYNDLINLDYLIDDIITIVNNKKLSFNLSGNYNNLILNANGNLDFTNDLKLNIDLSLEYNNKTINIYVYLLDNNLYLNYDNVKIYVSIDELKALVGLDDSMNVDSIISLVASIDFNTLINKLELNEKSTELGIDLTQFNLNLPSFIEIANLLNIKINDSTSGFNVKISELYDLNIDVDIENVSDITLDPTDYLDIKDIIDNIIDIINSKQYEIKLSGEFKGITLDGNIKIDRTNGIDLELLLKLSKNNYDINVKLYLIDEIIYLNYDNIYVSISLEELLSLLEIDLNNTISVDSILNILFSDKINDILKSINLNKNDSNVILNLANIGVDLSEFIDVTEDIRINLDNLTNGIGISAPKLFNLAVTFNISEFDEISIDNSNYYDIYNVINNVINLLDKNYYSGEISLSYKDINVSGNIVFDRINLNGDLNLNISYKNNSYDINIKYFNESKNIYLTYKDFKAYINVEELISKLDLNEFTFSVDKIIDFIFSSDFNNILKAINLNNSTKNVILDLSSITSIDLSKIIDVNEDIIITLDELENGLGLKANLLGLNVSVNGLDSIDEIVEPTNYTNLSILIDNVFTILDLINKESIRISIDGKVSLKDLVDFDFDINLNGYVDLLLEDDNYNVNVNLEVSNDKLHLTLNAMLIGNDLYINLLGLNIKIDISNIDSLIEEVFTRLGIENDSTFSIDSILPIIDTLNASEENDKLNLEIDLTSLLDKLGKLSIAFAYSANNEISVGLKLNGITLNSSLAKTDKYDLVLPTEYFDENDIYNLCDIIKVIIDLTKEKNFNIDLDFSVYDNGILNLKVYGTLKFIIYEDGRFDLEADGRIIQYEDGSIKMTHIVNAKIITKEGFSYRADGNIDNKDNYQDMLYLNYGTNPNNLSHMIKLYTPLSDMMNIVGRLTDIIGIDLSFLSKYIETSNASDIDTTQIKNLFDFDSISIDLDNLIKNFSITENNLKLGLDISGLLVQPENSIANLELDTNRTDGNIAYIKANNIYTVYNATGSTRFDIDYLKLKEAEATISVPSVGSGWYDISGLDSLVDGLLVTANNKEFAINGTVQMKVNVLGLGDLLNIDVPVDAKIHVNEDGSPIIYAHLDLTDVSSGIIGIIGGALVGAKHVYIYYIDGYVYVVSQRKSDTYQIKVTSDEFMSDILYYLLDFGMNLSDTILSKIEVSESNGGTVDAYNVLNSYSSSKNDTVFYFSLDLGELLQNSNLGDIEASLGLREVVTSEDEEGIKIGYALTDVNSFNVNLVSAIDLTLKDGLTLSNVVKGADNNYRFVDVDLSNVDTFVSGYNFNVDVIVKNGTPSGRRSHSVTFYTSGYGIDNTRETGIAGTTFTFPTYDYITYNGEIYVIEGWYTDKNLSKKCTYNTIQESNVTLYAKFVKGYKLTIVKNDSSKDYYLYENYDISSLLTNDVLLIDSKYYYIDGYKLNDELYESNLMPKDNIILTASLKEVSFKLYVDDEYYMDIDSNSLNLVGNYQILKNGIYYNYDGSNIDANLLFTTYFDNMIINGEYGYFYIETYKNRDNYYNITFDYNTKFASSWYYGISVLKGLELSYDPFDFGSYNNYSINYWYNANGEYYRGNINTLAEEDQTLKAYYASNGMTYTLNNGKASVLSYEGSSIDVIFPKYVLVGDSYYVLATMETVGEGSTFTGNTSIRNIYFNDGFETIINNAFKNCSSLRNIYFSDTITNVASDAFYIDNSSKFETNRDVCKNIRFYFTSNSSIKESTLHNWLACKWNSSERHYELSESELFGIAKADLRDAYQTYSQDLRDLVHNYSF